LTPCIEKKYYLDGRCKEYNCQLLYLCDEYGILYYESKEYVSVGGTNLLPGTKTYAFYWKDRFYNLYRWVHPDGSISGNYFNIADSLSMTSKLFAWRDLVVDLLFSGTDEPVILDENDLPDDIEPALSKRIFNTTSELIKNGCAIIEESKQILNLVLYDQ
jgi:predicted RNA-binding protein associated with RNAse of E/G family